MNNLITFFRLLFNQDESCPYWNFFSRRCMIDSGHSRGFETIEYCRHIDAVTICLHYKRPKK